MQDQDTMDTKGRPVGYHIQQGIPCCATCAFGGYLGSPENYERMCICEVHGEVEDSRYAEVAVEPLGICRAWKPNPPTFRRVHPDLWGTSEDD